MPRSIASSLAVLFVLLLAWGCGSSEPAQDAAPETPEVAETPAQDPQPPEAGAEEAATPGGTLNVDEEGRAVRGFDAVAYHLTGVATAGDPAISHRWQGADWLFANAENRDAFAAEPERFAPRNGGYCTFGVVLKQKLDVDPSIFLVQDDQLFLFLNQEVQDKFKADLEGNLGIVTSQWPEIAEATPEALAEGSAT